MNRFILMGVLLITAGCVSTHNIDDVAQPSNWVAAEPALDSAQAYDTTTAWWQHFGDDTLNQLVSQALSNSPTRAIARARVDEARGLRRSERAGWFPQFSLRAEQGREQSAFSVDPVDYSEAAIDASYEIDLFGRIRHSNRARHAELIAWQARYYDATLTLIGDVVSGYIDVRSLQQLQSVAERNLESQTRTLTLIELQASIGIARSLDVARARALVNTTRAAVPELKRRLNASILNLSLLTGMLPEALKPLLMHAAPLPVVPTLPILDEPAAVMARRPDIQAATALLNAQSSRVRATAAELFPSLSLGGFFGETDNVLADNLTTWRGGWQAAFPLLNFGRLRGRVDVAEAIEDRVLAEYQQTLLAAVRDVETAVVDQSSLNQQQHFLRAAFSDADEALLLSKQLYENGEVSFLDVLDAERTSNAAEASAIQAETTHLKSIVRLYKALGLGTRATDTETATP